MIPRAEIPEGLEKLIYYRIIGGIIGSVFVIVSYFVTRSDFTTFIVFIIAAMILTLYSIFETRRLRKTKMSKEEYLKRILILNGIRFGFVIYTIGVSIVIYLLFYLIR